MIFGYSQLRTEIPKPTINTEQSSYEFTGTGFMLSGYVEADCDCSFDVSIDGKNIETNDEGVFQKFIESHYTSNDGEVEIMATATSNGFRKLISQSATRAISYKRTATAFRIVDEPQSHNQEELTLLFSGMPYAEIKDKSWKQLTVLDENGSGSVTLPFNTEYYHRNETFKFHAQADGYDTTTVSINIGNALYDAERIALEKEAVEKERKEVAYKRKKEQAQKEKEEKIQKAYASAHTKSYGKLEESLEFMSIANEAMRSFLSAYYLEDGETMLASVFVYNGSLERARESIQESERLIKGVKIPSNIQSLHYKWISLIGDFEKLPDEYDDVMPKVIDGKAGAVEDAEALAIEMLELPQRAIKISQQIVTTLSY